MWPVTCSAPHAQGGPQKHGHISLTWVEYVRWSVPVVNEQPSMCYLSIIHQPVTQVKAAVQSLHMAVTICLHATLMRHLVRAFLWFVTPQPVT
jgi:hypothetical protein